MTPNISIENKNILIFHTHSCEKVTHQAMPSHIHQQEHIEQQT